MLSISKRARYGLRAMLYLAKKKKVASSKEIAQAEKIPYQFLEQIIHQLRINNLVESKRGAQGGYFLAKPKDQISMGDIIGLLEEDICLASCLGSTDKHCSLENSCLAKKGFKKLQQQLVMSMNKISLEDLLSN